MEASTRARVGSSQGERRHVRGARRLLRVRVGRDRLCVDPDVRKRLPDGELAAHDAYRADDARPLGDDLCQRRRGSSRRSRPSRRSTTSGFFCRSCISFCQSRSEASADPPGESIRARPPSRSILGEARDRLPELALADPVRRADGHPLGAHGDAADRRDDRHVRRPQRARPGDRAEHVHEAWRGLASRGAPPNRGTERSVPASFASSVADSKSPISSTSALAFASSGANGPSSRASRSSSGRAPPRWPTATPHGPRRARTRAIGAPRGSPLPA